MEIVGVIRPPDRTTRPPPEHLAEDVGGETPLLGSIGRPKPVEILLFLGIREDVIGALDLFEFFGVTRWFIRVKSKSEFAISLLDLFFCGTLRDTKSLVWVHPNFSLELLL